MKRHVALTILGLCVTSVCVSGGGCGKNKARVPKWVPPPTHVTVYVYVRETVYSTCHTNATKVWESSSDGPSRKQFFLSKGITNVLEICITDSPYKWLVTDSKCHGYIERYNIVGEPKSVWSLGDEFDVPVWWEGAKRASMHDINAISLLSPKTIQFFTPSPAGDAISWTVVFTDDGRVVVHLFTGL